MRKEKTIKKDWIFWTPRILSVIFLLFLAMFSLDVFDSASGFWDIALGLFMHNVPVFILAISLWLGWKREWITGSIFIFAGLAYIISVLMRPNFELYRLLWILQISGPAFFIGILFFVNWKRRKR